MPFWHRLIVVGAVLFITVVVARLVDRAIARRQLTPEALTRYRIVRRSVTATIIFIGLLSALLVIPQVRAVAGGLLASTAVLGIIVGFAAQRTLGNFIAGLLIAFTQPVRLGDEIEFDGVRGEVEEVGLTYTWVRTAESDRLVIPNEKLVSETVRNSTIRNQRRVAEVAVQIPPGADLRAAVRALEPAGDEVLVTQLDPNTVSVRRYADAGVAIGRALSDLRLDVAERLRDAGILAGGA